MRPLLFLACALIGVCGAIVAVSRLQAEATTARDSELQLMSLRLDLVQMRDVPWGANPEEGGDPEQVRAELQGMQERIGTSLAQLSRAGGLPEYGRIRASYARTTAALWEIFDAMAAGKPDDTGEASEVAAVQLYAADGAMGEAAARYRAQSARVLRQGSIGSTSVILLLFGAFAWLYVRAARRRRTAESLAQEIRRLLAASQEETLTDTLTGLGNRRALLADLAVACSAGHERSMLAIFDLDGFKQYNDNFGHSAGDSLLARIGDRLAETTAGLGTAYRLGGDEFCIVASAGDEDARAIAALAASALTESGEGFTVGCSYGIALIPADTIQPETALLLADQRMYEQKRSGRTSARRQSAAVLLQLLAERSAALGQHTTGVAALSGLTAAHLGLDDDERRRIRLAAELHDVGKAAIPDAILDKPNS